MQTSAISEISRPSFEPVAQSTATSYEHGPCDVPLLGETIGENLRRTVARFAVREALVVRHQGYRATYGELWEQVDLAARAFMARGVRKGDRVGIWAPNRYGWLHATGHCGVGSHTDQRAPPFAWMRGRLG